MELPRPATRPGLGWLAMVVLINVGMGGLLGVQWLAAARVSASGPTAARCASTVAVPGESCVGWQGPALTPAAALCHWHRSGTAYWAHCAAAGGRYAFRMRIACSRGGQEYSVASGWARSPDEIYSESASCGPGGVAHVVEVQTRP